MRDLAALDNVETLPWDCWDPMPTPSSPVDAAFFDRMAAGSEPVRVPPTVFSAVRKRTESLV